MLHQHHTCTLENERILVKNKLTIESIEPSIPFGYGIDSFYRIRGKFYFYVCKTFWFND